MTQPGSRAPGCRATFGEASPTSARRRAREAKMAAHQGAFIRSSLALPADVVDLTTVARLRGRPGRWSGSPLA
jgi:hypothetical protein